MPSYKVAVGAAVATALHVTHVAVARVGVPTDGRPQVAAPYVHREVFRLCKVVPAGVPRRDVAPPPEQDAQLGLELSPEQTVDDEVERGVHRDEQVAHVVVLLVGRARRRVHVAHDVEQYLVDGRRRLAHDEHDDDDDHDERDVVLVVGGARRHRLATAARHLEVVHEVDVEEDEDEQREQEDE